MNLVLKKISGYLLKNNLSYYIFNAKDISVIMFVLRICKVIYLYSGFNISIRGISSIDWFMFSGSYLGG